MVDVCHRCFDIYLVRFDFQFRLHICKYFLSLVSGLRNEIFGTDEKS